jgi:nucleoside-diphosphate-sugar epimerase
MWIIFPRALSRRYEKGFELRVLVTGANGLLGGFLCTELTRQGMALVPTGRRSEKIAKNVTYQRCELDLSEEVDQLLGRTACDAVVHCATQKDGEDGIPFVRNNLVSTINLAEASRRHGVRKLIFASTISVYEGDGPFQEDSPTRIENPYALSKIAAEHALQLFARDDFQVVTLRLAGLHGKARKDGVINSMIRNAVSGRALKVDEPQSCFSFTFMEDFSETMITLLKLAWPTPYAVYNLASPDTLSLSQLARLIVARSGSDSVLDNGNGMARNRTMSVVRLSRSFGVTARSIEARIKEMTNEL